MTEPTNRLIIDLVRLLAAGKINAAAALPLLGRLTSDTTDPIPFDYLVAAVERSGGPEAARVTAELRSSRLRDAIRFHAARSAGRRPDPTLELTLSGIPRHGTTEWDSPGDDLTALQDAAQLARDRSFLLSLNRDLPQARAQLEQGVRRHAESCAATLSRFAPTLVEELQRAMSDHGPSRDSAITSRQWNDLARLAEHAAAADRPADELNRLRDRYLTAATDAERHDYLDELCSVPGIAAAGVIRTTVTDPHDRDRAEVILACRFGARAAPGWAGLSNWLLRCERRYDDEVASLRRLFRSRPVECALLWLDSQSAADPELQQTLETWSVQQATPVDPDELAERYGSAIPPEEWRILDAARPVVAEVVDDDATAEAEGAAAGERPESATVTGSAIEGRAPADQRAATAPPVADAADHGTAAAETSGEQPVAPVAPVAPAARASLWSDHLHPFLTEQWYLVAGVLMVLAGSSLVAWYTWDRHWIIRYTLMPAMLGGFTWALAWLGEWIERRDEEFRATAAILRAAAIGLLPVNFMAVAVLSNDDDVAQKAVAVPVMALLWGGLFGYGLKRWSAGVHPRLGWLLGGTLLGLNALVMLGPLARTLASLADQALHIVIGVGFYLGFAAVASVIIRFVRDLLTEAMAREGRVPWFVGGTLTVTFLQVLLWVHADLRHVPHVATYAPMLVAAGGLILLAEQRAQQLSGRSEHHRGESFLGFAVILLGVLMGASHAWIRIPSFVLAGVCWLIAGAGRRAALHDWIGLTLIALGGASVGALPDFPRAWLPGLGLLLAVGTGAATRVPWLMVRDGLTVVCRGMQSAILMLTTVVAVLVQWELRSPPEVTALWLLLVTAGFFWRAWHDGHLRWVHSAMTVTAIALPYCGCVNFEQRTLEGNVVPFGLAVVSLVWLGMNQLAARRDPDGLRRSRLAAVGETPESDGPGPRPSLWQLIREARSTVLWIYGALAVAAMVLRVLFETDTVHVSTLHMLMDYSGPLLMAGVLGLATWYSRSLVPAAMAAVIVIILFPEIRATFASQFEALGWGTGLGGAASALGLVLAAFVLRSAAFLESPGDGDRFMNRVRFPFRRSDHTLLTWPLIGSALFLMIRCDTVTLLDNLVTGIEIRTVTAIALTGVSWLLLAVYLRRLTHAAVATWLGCFWLIVSTVLLYLVQAPDAHWMWPTLVSGVVVQSVWLLSVMRWKLAGPVDAEGSESPSRESTLMARVTGAGTDRSWIQPVLADPARSVLHIGTLLVTAACAARLLVDEPPPFFWMLTGSVVLQLVWHGHDSERPLHGGLLFALLGISVLAWTSPGSGPLAERVSWNHSLVPSLVFALSIQGSLLLAEAVPSAAGRVRGIRVPFQFLGALLVAGLLVVGLLESVTGAIPHTPAGGRFVWQMVLLAGAGFVTARSQASLWMALLSGTLCYAVAHTDLIGTWGSGAASDVEQRLTAWLSPWRLGVFSLVLAAAAASGVRIRRRLPWLFEGSWPQLPFRATQAEWIIVYSLAAASLAALLQTALPQHRDATRQLAAPFLAAVTWGLTGWQWRNARYLIGGGVLVALGNIHVVRLTLGDTLRPWGISDLQLMCLGLALTLIELTGIRLLARSAVITRSFNRASLGLAGLVLALIGANYFVHPDLSTITWQRFVVSGAMAWLAALYFRRAARRPMAGEESSVAVAEGMHHFGITIALWCGVLTIPVLRTPEVALFSLGFPLLYFWLRAEFGLAVGQASGAACRTSAAVLGFAIQFAYVFRVAFQMILFPPEDVPRIATPLADLLHADYYHSSSPFLMLVSVVLLRLHGLGGTSWLAVYGGLGLVTGSWFALTWLPGLSPFDAPMAAAWCAIGLAHFWTLVSDRRSPLRAAIERLAALDANQWVELRRIWGVCTLVATHAAVLWGLSEWREASRMVAPLIAGVATVVVHQGVIRGSSVYGLIAGAELLVALHADFLVDSYLDRDRILWVVLGVWGALLIAQWALRLTTEKPVVRGTGPAAAAVAAIGFAHVLYHRPWSTVGLWGFAIGVVLSLLTPRPSRESRTLEERIAAALPVAAPAWLVLFSQAEIAADGLEALVRSWPLLITVVTAGLTGGAAGVFQTLLSPAWDRIARRHYTLADQTLHWFAIQGRLINSCTLWACFAAAVVVQGLHYGRPFGEVEVATLLFLYAALAAGWYFEGELRHQYSAYVLLQLSVLGFFAVSRRQLMLTTNFWTPQYDVWASLMVSGLLTGFKQQWDPAPREVRIPLLGTLLALPVVALVWVMWNRLGTDVAMLVVGLHSLMFAWMGREDRESPYNLVATCGFVAFVLLLFWTRLELRVIHAYTTPVGIGVLAMLHLLRDRVDAETRNRVRLVTLLTMLGSVGYYALLDTRYPIAFHLTMIVFCLAAMGFGSLLKIRLYLVLGFSALMVDLASIVWRVIAGIEERGTRMSLIGGFVLAIGVGLVLGAIYVKTHRAAIDERLRDVRRRMGHWE